MTHAGRDYTLPAFFIFIITTAVTMDKTSISGKTTNGSFILLRRGERK